MFLSSDALRALDAHERQVWDWTTKTVLYVSWDWGPGGTAEALAGHRLVAALLDAGARVHVLAGPNGRDAEPSLAGRDPARYAVTSVGHPEVADNRIVRTWQMLQRGIPEPAGLWVADAVRAGLTILRDLPGDTIVYGRAMPASSNIVAWRLAMATGRAWVAHFSDPWPPVEIASTGLRRLAAYKLPLFRLWRRRLLEADALTFINPAQAHDVLGENEAAHIDRSFVVTHLSSCPDRAAKPQPAGTFHIVHSGNFYLMREHNAATLMRGLHLFLERQPAARHRVRFTQAGWAPGDMPEWVARLGLADVVTDIGRQSQDGVLELLDDANLLVAVDYAAERSTTLVSKFPDYVAARRPILVLTHAESAMGRLCNRDGAGLTANPLSAEEVAARIESVYTAWDAGQVDRFLPAPLAVSSFSRDRVLSELAGAFTVAARRAAARAGTLVPQ
jgi:glycosyltransferase involved in cell wall biosynthesis